MLRRAGLCDSMSSVWPSVTFWYRDHIGCNTWKIIHSQHGRTGPRGTSPKLGWNRVGVRSAISPKRCKIGSIGSIGSTLLWQTNRKSHTRFRLVPRPMTLDDLERPKRHSCRNKTAHQKHLNDDRSILSAAKSRPMILFSRNIKEAYMQIFAGVLSMTECQVQ